MSACPPPIPVFLPCLPTRHPFSAARHLPTCLRLPAPACCLACRSLAACEQLSRAGYGPLAWINGGFDTAQPGQLATKDNVDIRLGGE